MASLDQGTLALAVIVPAIGLVAVAVHVNAPVTLQARAAAATSAAAPAGVPAAPAGWSTVFSDDFTGAAGLLLVGLSPWQP